MLGQTLDQEIIVELRSAPSLPSRDRECTEAREMLCIVDLTGRIRWASHSEIHDTPWQAILHIDNGEIRQLGHYRNGALSALLEQCARTGMIERLPLLSLKAGDPTLVLARLFGLNGFSSDQASSPCLAIVLECQKRAHNSFHELLADTFNLTLAEQKVLECAIQRQVPKTISKNLGISLPTVRSHLQRIRDKLGCRRTSDLAWLALASPEEWNPPSDAPQAEDGVVQPEAVSKAMGPEKDEQSPSGLSLSTSTPMEKAHADQLVAGALFFY
jgi:DNA-binding CsgD family transcriptional regulator